MTPPVDTPPPDTTGLIDAWLENPTDEQLGAAVDQAIRDDPAACRLLLNEAAFRERLTAILRAARQDHGPAVMDLSLSRERRFGTTAVLKIAAALILAAFSVWAIRGYREHSRRLTPPGRGGLTVQSPSADGTEIQPPAVAVPPPPTPAAWVSAFAGGVSLAGAGSETPLGVSTGQAVWAGCALVSDLGGTARLRLGYGGEAQLYHGTMLGFAPTNGVALLAVRCGAVDFDIHPPPTAGTNDRPPFVVLTRDLAITVRGTQFRVLVDRANTFVGVRRGSVEVRRRSGGGSALLAAGRYTYSAPELQLTALPTECPYWRSRCAALAGNLYP